MVNMALVQFIFLKFATDVDILCSPVTFERSVSVIFMDTIQYITAHKSNVNIRSAINHTMMLRKRMKLF